MNINTVLEFVFKKNAFIQKSDPSMGFRILHSLLERSIRIGNLRVIDVTGGIHDFGDQTCERVCIRFQNSSAYWKLLLNPDLYLGEAYMDREIIIEEGTISDFLELVLRNIPCQGGFITPTTPVISALEFCMKRFQQINTLAKARENVSHHYDLSLDLYKLFLDRQWQYSCGYFYSGTETLEEAQENKMQHILTKLLINKDHCVLDVGCGRGGLARFIARKTGAKVTGVTLSKEQLFYAENKTREEGLSDLVTYKLCDYRNLDGIYDRVVSVGMFEHVGVNYYQTFFQKIRNLLHKDGVALLHSIGRSTVPTTTNPWIQKYIFPGGYLPALSEVIPHVEQSGLILTDLEVLRLHYAKTLNEWKKRFNDQRGRAQFIYDDRFCRMWEFYLASSEASFKHSGNMVFHMQLSRCQETIPITRSYLYEA